MTNASGENVRRGWAHAGLKLQLLTQGGDACSLKRKSERNIFYKYYAEEGPDDDYDSFGGMFMVYGVLFLCAVGFDYLFIVRVFFPINVFFKIRSDMMRYDTALFPACDTCIR